MAFNVKRFAAQSENRSWLRGPHGTEPGANANITLDAAAFSGLHPNGFVPSGTLVGKVTASGKYAPYDAAGADGSEVPAGFLFSSVSVDPGAEVLAGALYAHGFVNPDRLPIESGKGALDEAARTALTNIIFD